jgi:hypothetical protein
MDRQQVGSKMMQGEIQAQHLLRLAHELVE